MASSYWKGVCTGAGIGALISSLIILLITSGVARTLIAAWKELQEPFPMILGIYSRISMLILICGIALVVIGIVLKLRAKPA